MTLGARDYAVAQTIYRYWGPVGALLEPGSVLASGVLAALVRRRRPAFPLARAGTGLLGAALATWVALVAPMNAEMRRRWTPEGMPPGWPRVRAQWEYAHAVRFALHLAGLGALLASVVAETPPATPARRGSRPASA